VPRERRYRGVVAIVAALEPGATARVDTMLSNLRLREETLQLGVSLRTSSGLVTDSVNGCHQDGGRKRPIRSHRSYPAGAAVGPSARLAQLCHDDD
jgi:hypothetical protein